MLLNLAEVGQGGILMRRRHLWLSEEEKKDLKMRKGEYFIFLLLPAHEQGGCGDVRGGEGVGGQWGYKQVFT